MRRERGDMKLSVQHVDGMRFLMTSEEHSVVVDASRQDGGGATAMSAPQLFVAAVGACILEFVLNSCRLRGIPVDRLSADMVYEEVPRPRRVGSLEITIRLSPVPAEDVQARLLAVGRRATLVSTLLRPPELVLRFGDAAGAGNAVQGHVRPVPGLSSSVQAHYHSRVYI